MLSFGRCFGSFRTVFVAKRFLSRTALYDFHVRHGAKMVDFCGWELPLVYHSQTVSDSHRFVREKCGLFDVSHMLQTTVSGPQFCEFMESVSVVDMAALHETQSAYSLFTNSSGGIEDDFICTKLKDSAYVVSNAACAEKVKRLLTEQANNGAHDVHVEFLTDTYSLVALQGPKMREILQPICDFDLVQLPFMTSVETKVAGVPSRITRCGYTGEDGVEISVLSDDIDAVVKILMENSDLAPSGLAARNTLRLEAGMCLYGNDIDATTTPVEAVLMWTISKRRRHNGDFPGADVILRKQKEKPKKKRIGLSSTDRPFREHTEIFDNQKNKIGHVTSGGPSPSLGYNIGMGYVETAFLRQKIPDISFKIRDKFVPGKFAKITFVKPKYFIPNKS